MADERYETWTVDVPRALEEDLAGWLASEGLGAVVEPSGPDAVRLVVFVRRGGSGERVVREALERFGVDADPLGDTHRDRDWVAEYQRGLDPIRIGSRFLILPHEGLRPDAADADRIALPLVPGRAFGTGEHPTTRLCVEGLERHVAPGSRWLDVGAGSGILARVAAHLGADVEAVEIDPEASAVAAETLAADPPPRPIRWRTGGLEAASDGPFDGIVANIASSFFLKHASGLAARLDRDGVLLASGFLVEDREDLDAALRPHGVVRRDARAAGPWSDWIGRRIGT